MPSWWRDTCRHDNYGDEEKEGEEEQEHQHEHEYEQSMQIRRRGRRMYNVHDNKGNDAKFDNKPPPQDVTK